MAEEKRRCSWVKQDSDIYISYHDNEWGIPVFEDEKLFEMFLLECFQAGLSWLTILRKRESFRTAFDNFDVGKVSQYSDTKINELLQNAEIIRSRGKIAAAIKNAEIFQTIQQEYGSFSAYIWGFTDSKVIKNTNGNVIIKTELSDTISTDLKSRGMKYVGSITIYSYLQAVGIVNDHEFGCFRY